MYRVFIENREYTKYTLGIPGSKENVVLERFSPLEHHLFSGDIFSVEHIEGDPIPTIKIITSPVRNQLLAGVLILHENRTYGRSKNGRLLYKCMPDDKRLPPFLVPYDIKIGFSKKQVNKYVTFTFTEWNMGCSHPRGIIQETIGQVDSLDAYYEYQLYCKNLHESLTEMTKSTQRILSSSKDYPSIIQENGNFVFTKEDQCEGKGYVFSIDPQGSSDYDDAFRIDTNPDTGETTVTVYIANVFVWLETLGLWSAFSRRVSTIYLPDKRRPMLPTILSENWCSLQENTYRFVFGIQWRFDAKGAQIDGEPKMIQQYIHITENFVYESDALLSNPHYQQLFSLTKCIDPRGTCSSHDVVSLWMVKFNTACANWLESRNTGIFRYLTDSSIMDDSNRETAHLTDSCRRAIQQWNNTIGQYSVYSVDATKYMHITSPIRRLVDLLNQIILFRESGLVTKFSKDCVDFLENWINQLDYINVTMRSIRKVQLDCHLLARVLRSCDTADSIYTGVVFDKVCKNNGFFTYIVYLDSIKLVSRITVDADMANYSQHSFQLYLFQDEHCTKQKIKLQML